METSSVRAVLFVKDLVRASTFYVGALGMTRKAGDQDHAVLECDGFELVVHQIPRQIAETIPKAINSASANASRLSRDPA